MSDTHAGENNLYVIQSKIGGSDWVITVKGDSNYNLRLNHNTVDQRQLWVREDDKSLSGNISDDYIAFATSGGLRPGAGRRAQCG